MKTPYLKYLALLLLFCSIMAHATVPSAPKGTSAVMWSTEMLRQLRNDYYNANPNVSILYDYVQFKLNGNITSSNPDNITLGRSDNIPSRDSWISESTTACPRTYPHELGHCLGLSHRNDDLDVLMCQTKDAKHKYNLDSTKLRRDEWNAINN